MSPGLLTILTFLAAALAVVGLYSLLSDLFLRDRSRVSQRLDEEFRRSQREQIRKSALFKEDFGRLAAEAGTEDEARPGLRRRFEALVEQSGLNLTPDRLLLSMAVAGLGCGALAGLLRHSVLVAAAGGLAGAAVPFLYVRAKRKARLEKLLRQLPDAFDLMSRVIRAGQAMAQAIQAVADEFDQPIAGEFAYCYEQQNLGLPPEVALRDLARRSGLLEVKIFVLALLVQQQSGGNLAEMLDKLSHVVRERFRIRAKIKAVTAEGRAQAVLLLAMPIALMFIFIALSDIYAQALGKYPNMIVAMLVAEAVGAVWIRRIVNFDY
jgi:tight adherence protein B